MEELKVLKDIKVMNGVTLKRGAFVSIDYYGNLKIRRKDEVNKISFQLEQIMEEVKKQHNIVE